MERIFDKIYNKKFLDSEIIQDIESAKYKDPEFDINLGDKYNWSSLIKAVIRSREELVKYLLSDPNINVNHSCFWGLKACVKEYFLDARGDTLICDVDGETGRDKALKWGYPDIAKIINNSLYTTLLRIPNNLLLHDIVRMIIEEYT